MRVIPAIDIMDGKVVRLSEGDFSSRKDYPYDPVEAAKIFSDGGLGSLHVVDLDAARGTGNNIHVLERMASAVPALIDFGGGIRRRDDVVRALDAGAGMVNVGSAAVRHPDEVIAWNVEFPGRIILSADVRDGFVSIGGWTENTDRKIIPFLESFMNSGISMATVTDISRDGMLQGPSFGLYSEILSGISSINLIASGGVSSIDDLERLSALGLYGAIVGRAYDEGKITIAAMKEAECSQNA